MKRKDFTLKELLAVIVVLAIIALIATPIVMNTIKNAKKGAAERTADNYIKQVETAVAEARIDGTKLVVGDYNVKYKDDKLAASEPYNGILCKANATKATALVWTGNANPANESSYTREEVGLLASEATSKYDVGVTYTCELEDGEENTFYVLETNGDNVSLIAGMNLGATVAWVTKEDYLAAGGTESDYGSHGNNNLCPVTVNKVLKEGTASWTKLDESQIKLPSGQQIATAGGDTNWTENNYTGTILPTWLSSHTKFTTGTYGYWTSSPDVLNARYAWTVRHEGRLDNYVVSNPSNHGIRPVITVLKSNLS